MIWRKKWRMAKERKDNVMEGPLGEREGDETVKKWYDKMEGNAGQEKKKVHLQNLLNTWWMQLGAEALRSKMSKERIRWPKLEVMELPKVAGVGWLSFRVVVDQPLIRWSMRIIGMDWCWWMWKRTWRERMRGGQTWN